MFHNKVVLVILCLNYYGPVATLARNKGASSTKTPKFTYPPSYRDHVYRELSENGKKLFFAINIHPLCEAKEGVCIKRQACIDKEMLYISRVCYHSDLVCCYDNSIRNPVIGTKPRNVGRKPTETTDEAIDSVTEKTTKKSADNEANSKENLEAAKNSTT